jgi:hypothetical protein
MALAGITRSIRQEHPAQYPAANAIHDNRIDKDSILVKVRIRCPTWFGHLWAHAGVHGIPEILSEDFEHGRHCGRVRMVNPFLGDEVHELPPLYATT